MKRRVLVSAPYMQPVLSRFQEVFAEAEIELVVPTVREHLNEKELLPLVGNIEGAICGDDQFTERVLLAAKRLKVIAKWGTGIDSIDRDAAARLGIAVYNTPDAFTEPVADTVMGYILCFARQLSWMDRDIRHGLWQKRASVSLRECTLGVIGVGNIGKGIIRRAAVFGMRLLGNDIVPISPGFVVDTGLQPVSKDELLRQADFVSLNCDLNSTSFQLIGEQEFALMKPTAYLINTARGLVVNERALVETLRRGTLAGAALDVFEIEPLPQDSSLRNMDNVLLAPHNSNSSPAAWERVHRKTIQNLLDHLSAPV